MVARIRSQFVQHKPFDPTHVRLRRGKVNSAAQQFDHLTRGFLQFLYNFWIGNINWLSATDVLAVYVCIQNREHILKEQGGFLP